MWYYLTNTHWQYNMSMYNWIETFFICVHQITIPVVYTFYPCDKMHRCRVYLTIKVPFTHKVCTVSHSLWSMSIVNFLKPHNNYMIVIRIEAIILRFQVNMNFGWVSLMFTRIHISLYVETKIEILINIISTIIT